jgi:hypothetical protein
LRMYQPVMSDENVRRLYFLKLEKRRPMTRLLDEILNKYFERHDQNKEGGEECMSVRYAETVSKSNENRKGTTSDTATAPSAEPSMTQ